jgi:hypothetical protein
LKLLEGICLLVRETTEYILYFLRALLQIHKDAWGSETHVGGGIVPERTEETIDAAAADDVGCKVEGATGGDGTRLAKTLFKGANTIVGEVATACAGRVLFGGAGAGAPAH